MRILSRDIGLLIHSRYLKGKPKLGLWYPRVSSFDLESYSDSDYAGANLDRKSTTRGCQFLGRRLISWQCKKQTIVATSTTEEECVAAASCCRQVLWIQNQMLDYGFNFMNTKIYIDNESTICIVKNPVYHSKTKHIAIRHHFIRDAYEKKLIQVLKIHIDDNVDDLLTKAFDVSSVNTMTFEEMVLKWQLAMISIKEWKKISRRMGRLFARDVRIKGNQDNRRLGLHGILRQKQGMAAGMEERRTLNGIGDNCWRSDASIEIKEYSQGLKKVEAQLVAHQQGQLCANDSFGLGLWGSQIDGNLYAIWPDIKVDYSQFHFRSKQAKPSESESQSSEFDYLMFNPKVWSDVYYIEEYESDSEFEHMTGNKAYLAEFQDFNGKPLLTFGGRNGAISLVRFSWVFFLRTKDETSGILKDFIRQIENQLNQKVKTIRCDNGTEFKNKDVIEFCGSKGIKREYSNARTPQQNGVAERKNKTLIEAYSGHCLRFIFTYTFWDEARKGPTWLFDLDYLTDSMNYHPVRSENQANLHAGRMKKRDGPREEDTSLFGVLESLLRAQERSIPVSTDEGLSLSDPTNPKQDDSEIPPLEDIYQNFTDGIFTNSSYDDEGAVADFTNLETVVNKVIGTKWVYRNKKDERGIVVRNKARLVTQGHRQEEGIDYDEVFAPVARIEAIRIFLAFASYMGFIVYQMNVKSAFLYGKMDEELPEPVQVYVDDIIFGSTKKSWCDEFEAFKEESRISMLEKILKKFDFAMLRLLGTPIETQMPFSQDEAEAKFQVTPKSSHLSVIKRIFSDYARANLDRKSTTGGCQFLGRRLISWQCKKQTIVATSTTDAEYVVELKLLVAQSLVDHSQMLDYGFNFINTRIYIDNESTICIVKNPVYHSKTKHIVIRHHFIRDAYEKKLIQVLKIHTDDNVADLLTKAFDVSRESLRRVIDGTEALLFPTLFILGLDTVSIDSAKLVPLGKVIATGFIETVEKEKYAKCTKV
ncbi:putative ribonuclease H-like domain-containing protein [Tanacetum coccineum]